MRGGGLGWGGGGVVIRKELFTGSFGHFLECSSDVCLTLSFSPQTHSEF